MDTFTTRTTCRLCTSSQLRPVLDLGMQALIRFTKSPSSGLPAAPLDLCRCDGCGLLQLRHTTNPDLLFREFWYRSGVNASMREALRDVVEEVCASVATGVWVDVGANDGFLLSAVPESFNKVAFEPAQNFKSLLEEHASVVVPDYFRAGMPELDGCAEVITSIAMFYDLDDPNQFVADIAKTLSPTGIWVNQLNDSPTMLLSLGIDSICHEHLTYYDVPTLERLYRRHGLKIVRISFNGVNGGSVRVTARKAGNAQPAVDLLGIRTAALADAEAFASRARRWRDRMRSVILSHAGSIWAYGASTKGSTLLQYLDLPPGTLEGVADRNPLKHGTYMPGSDGMIQSEDAFREARPDAALVLPYAFRSEFDVREAETRASGTVFIYPLPDISLVV